MISAEGSKEAEQLREVVLKERARLKEVELEAERWMEQSRKLQAETEAGSQENAQLKKDRQRKQEVINRCVCFIKTSYSKGCMNLAKV